LHKIAVNTKSTIDPRRIFFRVARALNRRSRKKPLFYRMFCRVRKIDALACRGRSQSYIALENRVVRCAAHVLRDCAIHIVKSSNCFFHCAVVNQMQCVSIPDRTKCDTRHVTWLGGQQMAKRKKKAVKVAKKKKGKKKRL